MSLPVFLKIPIKWCGFCGFLPYYDSKKRNLVRLPFYSNIFLIFHLIAAIASLLQIPEWYSDGRTTINNILRTMLYTTLSCLTMYMAIGFTTFNLKKMSNLIVNLQKLQYNLKVYHGIDLNNKREWSGLFIVFQLVYIALIAMELYGDLSLKTWQFLWASTYLLYYFNILLIVEYSILKQLKISVESINTAFNKIICTSFDIIQTESRVWNLCKLQLYVSDVAESFNYIFGWHILGFVFVTIMSLLSKFDGFLNKNVTWSLFETVNFFIWTFMLITLEVILARICEKVSSEAKNTLTLVFTAFFKYSDSSTLRMKLSMFAWYCKGNHPQFTAAGFFNINRAMLFTFVNLMTTYLIVIVQFRKKE